MPKITALMAKLFAAVTGRTVEVKTSTYIDAVAVKGKRKPLLLPYELEDPSLRSIPLRAPRTKADAAIMGQDYGKAEFR
ncbi:hypothetical protein LTR05_006911 [Lithohypha guttulata]|uniref:Uncharacterized protein n=1 Tax=Lithohypha guttulata TaxID=1690604 RepID=A0AAN7Y580_9EURO|nr:hypothetical protein LTR05_006911 [Lithohypha guttulata]